MADGGSARDRNSETPLGPGRRALVGAVLALGATALPGAAAAQTPQTPAAVRANPRDQALLARIAQYLNGIHSMTAQFAQISSDGRTASGSIWIERPGGMRVQYDPPSPILLLADRFYVYYIDQQLAQVNEVGLKSTPAWFLLRDPIRFGGRVVVTKIQRTAGEVQLTLGERKHPGLGSLTIALRRHPLALQSWTVVDRQGRKTKVTLSQQQFGMALDPKLFQYRNPYTGRLTEP